ncbi:MAG: glutathione S-transferase family protein [Pseudomonadota bacterium]
MTYTVVGTVPVRTLRVLWTLEELALPYDLVPAAPASQDAIRLTGTGKVPALIEDGQNFTDSVAIITYLADKHGRLTFPAGTQGRLAQDGHMGFVLEEFDAVLWSASKHSFVYPAEHRVPQAKDSLKWEFQRSLDRLEHRLGDQPFLMGDQMTIADIVAVHCLNWSFVAKFPTAPQRLKDYSKRLRKRPAYRAAMSRA